MAESTIEERVAIIETEVTSLKHSHKTLQATIQCIHDKVHQTERHIVRQNGALPHMQNKLEEIAETQSELSDAIEATNNIFDEHKLESAKFRMKVGILWSIIVAVGMSLLGIGGKLAYDGIKKELNKVEVIEKTVNYDVQSKEE